MGHSLGESFTNPILITLFVLFRPEGHQEHCNEAGFLSPDEHLVKFEQGNFRF